MASKFFNGIVLRMSFGLGRPLKPESFFLKISVVGLSAVYDIKLSVNEDFLKEIPRSLRRY